MTLDEQIRAIVREEIAATRRPNWRWLTTKQAAELLGITPHRVAARVREGKLPGKRFGGRTYVDGDALAEAFERGSR